MDIDISGDFELAQDDNGDTSYRNIHRRVTEAQRNLFILLSVAV